MDGGEGARAATVRDAEGKMNLALADVERRVLVVSQFTLYGDAREGPPPELH